MDKIDLESQGYQLWRDQDPFEDFVGPLYYREEPDGTYRCAFEITEHHINGQGGLHGGMLMTFGDYALFIIAHNYLKGMRAVTVTFDAQFTAVANLGALVECTGEVIHETHKMLFMRGTIQSDGKVLLNFSSVLKKIRPRN